MFPADSLFCPQCGAPQLVLTEADVERVAAEHAISASTTGPMPRISGAERIRWRPVLQIVAALALIAALAVALGAAVPLFSLLGWFFVFSAPMLTLNLYQRRVPGAPMGAAIGARIGIALGLLMAFVLTAENAIGELIYRYPMHNAAKMDLALSTALQSMSDRMATYPSFAGNAAENQRLLHFFATPDGHAAMALAGGAMLAGGLLIYCFLSGMVLGWLRPVPTRRNAV